MADAIVGSLLQTAQSHLIAGQIEPALALLRQATRQAPHQPMVWQALGSIAGQWGLIDEAMDSLARAVQLKPDFAAAYNDLRQVYCLARRLDRAIDCFRKALAIEPNYLTAANNLVYYLHF